ncbi:MAG: polysulfide reductase NrfD [Nitrospiraceae bacterium]|nr:polysulfide reductase NrfD [Nitrospiraceae bacterium]
MENREVQLSDIVKGVAASFDSSFPANWWSNVLEHLSGRKIFYVLLALSGLIVFAAAMAGLDALNIGHRVAYGVTREIPWGLLIATYIFFVVTSTGLCIVSSIGHVFGLESFMPIAKRSVFLAIVTILAGFSVIFFEIENPFRMAIYNVISPNLSSNIWWMGTLYGAYLVFMIIEYAFLLIGNHRFAMYAGLMGLIAGISAHSNLGAIFGALHARPFWYGPFMPIYFIASAMMSGAAAIIFFTYLGYKLNGEMLDAPMERALEVVGKVAALMISILLFFEIWKVITGLDGGPSEVATMKAILAGPYAINFLGFEITIGMVIPFILFLRSRFRNIGMMFAASMLMLVGIFMMRYDIVVVGQIVPSYYELGVNEYSHLMVYHPSFHEIMITAGGMGIAAMTFLLGERVFRGHKSEIH